MGLALRCSSKPEEHCGMKAFIIIPNNSQSKKSMFVPTLSAFADIDSIGIAGDVGEAIDIIQQRYPNVMIFNSRILEEKEHNYLESILEAGGSFVVMPRHMQYKDRCIYIGIDFSVVAQKGWVLNEIGETLREYRHFTAK